MESFVRGSREVMAMGLREKEADWGEGKVERGKRKVSEVTCKKKKREGKGERSAVAGL